MTAALAREHASEDESVVTLVADDAPTPPEDRIRPRRQFPASWRAGAPAWMWVGTSVVGLGFILIAVAWGQVAAEVDVYRQLPYVVSAALVGLGFVLVGLTILNIVSRRRDGIARDRQVDELVRVLNELKQELARERRS